jgi:hypothetical protein
MRHALVADRRCLGPYDVDDRPHVHSGRIACRVRLCAHTAACTSHGYGAAASRRGSLQGGAPPVAAQRQWQPSSPAVVQPPLSPLAKCMYCHLANRGWWGAPAPLVPPPATQERHAPPLCLPPCLRAAPRSTHAPTTCHTDVTQLNRSRRLLVSSGAAQAGGVLADGPGLRSTRLAAGSGLRSTRLPHFARSSPRDTGRGPSIYTCITPVHYDHAAKEKPARLTTWHTARGGVGARATRLGCDCTGAYSRTGTGLGAACAACRPALPAPGSAPVSRLHPGKNVHTADQAPHIDTGVQRRLAEVSFRKLTGPPRSRRIG